MRGWWAAAALSWTADGGCCCCGFAPGSAKPAGWVVSSAHPPHMPLPPAARSYEMMQRLTCDACKGRGPAQPGGAAAGQRPPCRDPQNCLAAQRWKVVIADGGCWAVVLSPADAGLAASNCARATSSSDASRPAPLPPAAHPESHTLRTSNRPPDAAHTEAVVSAARAARRAVLLTGTPSLSRPYDLFRQVGWLGAGRGGVCVCGCVGGEGSHLGPSA